MSTKTNKIKIKASWMRTLRTSPKWVSNGHWMIRRGRVTLPNSLPIDHPVGDEVFEQLIRSGGGRTLIQFQRTDWDYRSSFRLFLPVDTDIPAPLWLDDDYVSGFGIEYIWASRDTRKGVMCLDEPQPDDVRFALMSCDVNGIDLASIRRLLH